MKHWTSRNAQTFLPKFLYFDNFHRYLKEVDFPHARTVRFHTGKPINVNFLKCWKKSNWNIKVAAFGLPPEDLNAFKELESRRVFSCCLSKSSKQSSIISKTLTDFQIPFDKKEGGTDKKHFEVICKSLEVLKDAFPSLVNITGTIYNLVDYRHLMSFVQTSFFNYVGFFTAAIDDTIRPEWCQRLRLVISVVLPIEKYAEISYEPFVKELKRQVQRCRKNMLHLNYIYDPVPGIETFDHYPTRCCLAVVQVGTAHADFQFSFKVARGPNS
ncbi:hypothetical protein M3Y97_00944700 [Aphelenchoides bicaudatus]|nr:hypothetical protein M3Y97_00944700 [Aphelenchoides bicaudatus]